ncbi:MAG: sterol desaturase family protein [Rhodospirillales bacterium]|nr:sterol desaturase family protein [Rhodospirillales bacterium]
MPFFDLASIGSILTAEYVVRPGVFFAVFALVALWEMHAPRRARIVSRRARWPSNLALIVLNAALIRLLFPAAAVGVALFGAQQGWGLLPLLAWPAWATVVVAVVLLDLAIYVQHVVFHAVPALWRLHRMHHADLDFDVTTGARFHPLEILLSMAIKFAVIAVLGAPALAVLIFEVLLNATSMFNHANAGLPAAVERAVRWLVVTPDMHRVHHSVAPVETNSNFGFNLPWWDRLFGTYRAAPAAGHRGMTIGLAEFRDAGELRLDRLLTQPFRDPAAPRPLGRPGAAT